MKRQHTEHSEKEPDTEEESCTLLDGQLAHMAASHIAEHHAENRRQYAEREERTSERIAECKAVCEWDEVERRKDICRSPHKHPEQIKTH